MNMKKLELKSLHGFVMFVNSDWLDVNDSSSVTNTKKCVIEKMLRFCMHA